MDDRSADGTKDELLFNLFYCSRVTKSLTDEELQRLVVASRQRNLHEDITGWLVHSHGVFFQWLEGAREKVERLMATIAADPRHNTLVTLSDAEEVRGRVFSGWAMELVSVEDIRGVLLDALDAATDPRTTSAIQMLLYEVEANSDGVSLLN